MPDQFSPAPILSPRAGELHPSAGAGTPTVAVLFARSDSVYKRLPGTDVWDIERDARLWPGGMPVVAHPPCRAWGCLAHMAKPRPDERDLALWAVDRVREYGGVLEHPRTSRLWLEKPLPLPGEVDAWGGWTLPVLQWWWGHKAAKSTKLYIVGIRPNDLPAFPFRLGIPDFVVSSSCRRRDGSRLYRREISKAEREQTPPAFADWLLQLARCTSREACHV